MTKTKKLLAITVSLLLLCFALTSCGSSTPAPAAPAPTPTPGTAAPADPAPAPAEDEYYNLTIGTAAATGTYFPIGAAISEIATQYDPNLFMTAQATGGSVENIKLVSTGDADVGFANQMHFIMAERGEGSFSSPVDNIRSVCILYGPEYVMAHAMQIVVPADSPVQSIYDLKGMNFSVGPAGSGTEQYMGQIVESIGMSYDDFNVSYLSYEEQEAAMADGLIDAASYYSAAPTGGVESLAATNDVRLLDLGDDIIEKCAADWGFRKQIIPNGTYSFQDKDCTSVVADYHCIFVNQDMDENLAYRITKLIYDHVEELYGSNVAMENVTAEGVTEGWSRPALHPGAIRYLEEKGIEIPEGAYPPEYQQ